MANNSKKNEVNNADEFDSASTYVVDSQVSDQISTDFVEDLIASTDPFNRLDDPSERERSETISEVVVEMQRTNERLDIENQRLRQALMSQQNQTEDGYRRMAFELVRSLSTNPAGDPRNQPTAALDKRLKVLVPSYPATWV